MILLLFDLIFTFLDIKREHLYVTCGDEPSEWSISLVAERPSASQKGLSFMDLVG
jgi:hypothetical protein